MKISFIIIAYNEETNISHCINSILSQNELADYEVIVINDASKDSTSQVVKNLIKKNKNIKLIDLKLNKGRGNARYIGVKKAIGNYIAFVDADIILPKNWLNVCFRYLKKYDAVGGIAVPDGDVAYIFNKFNLKPKLINHTTEITGSNGIFKNKIFKNINFNKKLSNGEDFDLNERLKNKGFKLKSVKDLIVRHNCIKDYSDSLKWLYQSGEGSTRLIKKYKKIRLPDVAFFGFIFFLLIMIFEGIFLKTHLFLVLFLLYPLITSFLHIRSRYKFESKKILSFLLAIVINYSLILAYYVGRIIGVLKWKKLI
ncbi:MAG: glycosyltransferase [archaeon]